MKIDGKTLYGPCPCGSGKKFKFCCWPKCRNRIEGGMTKEEIEQIVCELVAGAPRKTDAILQDESHGQGQENSAGGIPKGVVELKDEDRLPILHPVPKWRMEYKISEENELEDDVNAVVDGLVRPYAEKYCSFAGEGPEATVAVVITRLKRGARPIDSPTITTGTYSQLWDMLRSKIEELMEWLPSGTVVFDVKYDQMFGGPMLSIEEAKGDIEIFTVAIPHRFGKDDW